MHDRARAAIDRCAATSLRRRPERRPHVRPQQSPPGQLGLRPRDEGVERAAQLGRPACALGRRLADEAGDDLRVDRRERRHRADGARGERLRDQRLGADEDREALEQVRLDRRPSACRRPSSRPCSAPGRAAARSPGSGSRSRSWPRTRRRRTASARTRPRPWRSARRGRRRRRRSRAGRSRRPRRPRSRRRARRARPSPPSSSRRRGRRARAGRAVASRNAWATARRSAGSSRKPSPVEPSARIPSTPPAARKST